MGNWGLSSAVKISCGPLSSCQICEVGDAPRIREDLVGAKLLPLWFNAYDLMKN